MNENVSQNQKELEEKTIDDIARFLVIAARDLYRREKDGEDLSNLFKQTNERSK